MSSGSVVVQAGMLSLSSDAGWSATASVPDTPIVRISLGWFSPEKEALVAAILDYTDKLLGDAIKKLPGLIFYYSAIDREHHAMVNVSLWKVSRAHSRWGSCSRCWIRAFATRSERSSDLPEWMRLKSKISPNPFARAIQVGRWGQASFYFNDPFGNHLELVTLGFIACDLPVGVPDRSRLDYPWSRESAAA